MTHQIEADPSRTVLLARIERQREIIRELLAKNEELRIRLSWMQQNIG